MINVIDTKNAPGAVGAYSQAIAAHGFVFTSGQLPINPVSGTFEDDIKIQAHQCMKNVGEIIKAAGGDYSDIVKTTILLTDITDFAEVNDVYASYFEKGFPARSCFQVAALPKDAKIEIEAIAYITESGREEGE